MRFLTVPREAYLYNANRDQLVEPEAERLFERVRRDEPVEVAPGGGSGAEKARENGSRDPDESASPAPTFRGNTAAEDTCG